MFSVRSRESAGRTLITVVGDVDMSVADRLWREIEAAAVAGAQVTVDCAGITFIDSSGLSVLVRGMQAAESTGAGFRLGGISESLHRVLELAGAEDLFEVVGPDFGAGTAAG